MQTANLTVAELPASNGTRFTADLYDIADANGVGMGCGTADEIRDMVADGILPADISLALIWTADAARVAA